MTGGKALNMLWIVALFILVFESLADLLHGNHTVPGLVFLSILLAFLIRLSSQHLASRHVSVPSLTTEDFPELLRQLSEHDRARVIELAASKNEIKAIRLTRKLLHVSLPVAKEAVDQIARPCR